MSRDDSVRQPTLTLRDWLLPRVLDLTYTAWDLEPFARDCLGEGMSTHAKARSREAAKIKSIGHLET